VSQPINLKQNAEQVVFTYITKKTVKDFNPACFSCLYVQNDFNPNWLL
jgi:hypothetical protein